MKKTTSHILNPLIIAVFILVLGSCKKYPENTIWFKRAKKLKFFDDVRITSYRVNGIDSLSSFNKYFGSKVSLRDITNTYFIENYDQNYDSNIPILMIPDNANGGQKITFFYSYSKNKKKINIFYDLGSGSDTAIFSKSLFVDQITEWYIVKFDPKGERKIKTKVNGNTYEMEFNKFYR